MKTVIVTGCCGLIGQQVAIECLKKGWMVLGIDKITYASDPGSLNRLAFYRNFTLLKEDICDLKYLPDCDYVINLAAESHVGNSIIDSTAFMKSNVLGVQNLLELIRHKPSNITTRPVFLHFSTDEVYGDVVEGKHTELDPLKPSNPYAAMKASADMLVLAWNRTYNIDYNIVRPTNNYGVGQHYEKLIPLSVRLLQQEKKIRLHDQGTPVRNWLHAEDTARAILTILEYGKKNEIYNIAGNCEQTNRITVEKIIRAYFNKTVDCEQYLDLSYKRQGQDVRYALDDSKLQALGWQPIKMFDEEIEDLVEHYKSNFRW